MAGSVGCSEMSKSNHQKYSFVPLGKWARGIKGFVSIPRLLKHERWNGSPSALCKGEIGMVESVRFTEK